MSYKVRFPLTQDLIDFARAEIRFAEVLSDDLVADVARRVQFRAEKDLRLAPGRSSRDNHTQPSREVLRAAMERDTEWAIAHQLQPGAHELVRNRLRRFGLRDPALTELTDETTSVESLHRVVRNYQPERSEPANHIAARLRFAAASAFRKHKRRSERTADWDDQATRNIQGGEDAASAAIARIELREVGDLLGPERLYEIVQYTLDDSSQNKTPKQRQAVKRIRADLRKSSIRDV
jgi:hypothetical protein